MLAASTGVLLFSSDIRLLFFSSAAMEFWGVEVRAGKPTQCSPGEGMYLHVSQAALGESKAKGGKGSERVVLKVHVDGSDIVLGTLAEGRCDQMPLDLVFDSDFSVSHSSSSSSIFLCGYRTEGPREYDSEDEDEEEDEEDEDEEDAGVPVAVPIKANGAAAEMLSKVTDKAAAAVANAIAKGIEKKVVKKQVIQDDSSDEEDDSEDSDDSDEDMDEDDDDDDDDEDDEDDESEEEELKIETPKAGKKRPAAEPLKVADKKSKTDSSPLQAAAAKGTKGEKQVTPSKDAPKTPTDKGAKAKAPKGTPTAPPTTPVSEKKFGQYKCTGCDRTFTTESAMSQHVAAKHKA
uniref:C2H2-type domain-containing protein n=1 Tax=Physcomitrium patens TaxID=3218 RepID=A0A7I4D566_PHYPA|nr:histone deacetylase HDT2-like isoform X3 [Physcomitrium patens]|eukprot:XP_024368865.1 histone deacetylase HDT2-like isoform X3 [Physcomitrella patens]